MSENSNSSNNRIYFLQPAEITRIIEYYWRKFWNENRSSKIMKENIDRIEEIHRLFRYIKYVEDLNKIFFLDRRFIKEIRKQLTNLFFGKPDNSLILLCNEFLDCHPNESKSNIKELYFIMGRYDFLAVIDAPNLEAILQALLTAASAGTMNTETLTAIPINEVEKILKELP